ncbi:Phage-related minor tail protein [Oceanobacillus oncorhynchi]|uniref:Phage-related minor tail protein n=1 Tax=Oceanobacillus oncorhynchi TaxID=545501 RepID=A0A0A1MQM8_9BACI|nr:phage tail tape measure protein [Oceanobacillus oncorhynchi]CEI81311.1 Phage-related minor tail protein [Oceanobacillus oncorhynchi]
MATVRELLAKFEGSYQGFKSSVSGMKSEMDDLDKKTKDATKSMSQKFTDFGDGLKKKGKTMFKGVTLPLMALGGVAFTAAYDMDKAYNNIIVGTGATGDALEGLKDTLKNAMKEVPNSADEVSNAISNINTITGATGGTLEDLTIKILDASRMLGEDGVENSMAFSKALEQFQIPAEDGVAELENLFRMTQDYGIGLDTLTGYITKFGPVMNNAGFSMGETAAFMSQLEANGIQVTKVMPGLNQGFSKWAEEGKDVREEFGKVVTQMQNAGSESEALNIASEAFGSQGAQRITTAVRNGTIPSLDELGDVLEGNEGLIDSTNDRTKTMGERIMEMKNRVQVAMEPIGKIMLDFAESIMPKVEQAIEKLSNWFGSISEQNQKWIVILSAMAAAIGPVLMVLGMFAGWIGNLIGLLAPFITRVKDAGGMLKWVRPLFAALGGPVGLIIGLITALGAGFVVAYKKSETFRNIVNNLKDKFVELYEKVKEFLTTNESFLGFIDSIKNGFSTAKDLIMQAFGVAMDFVQEKIGQVKSFWDTNGAQILQAFQNVFSGIWSVVQPILNGIVDLVKWAFPYIKTIIGTALNVAFSIVKMIWGNIKGVIDGALNIIMGLVKTFSSLFTGDWSGMWEGIKQVLSGAVQFIWNFIQLSFFGKIIKGGLVFVKSFAGSLSTMWTNIKNIFSTVIKWIVDFVKNRFAAMQNTISSITTGIRNVISTIWNFIWGSILKPIITNIYNFVRNSFRNIRDTTSNIFGSIRDTARTIWNKIKDNIINPVKDGVNWAITKFNDFKSSVGTTFKNIYDDVTGWISDMVQKVKDMPGEMKKKIVEGAGKVKEGFKAIGRKMVDGIALAVNGVGSAVNWVAGKLGMDDIVGKWVPADSLNWYAKGTGSHPGGHAVLGDGKGSNAGRELTILPNGQSFLSADKPTLYPNLPKGTAVIPANKTKELMDVPKYALGDAFGKAVDVVGDGVSWTSDKISAGYNYAKDTTIAAGKKIGEWTGNVWDYVSNPGKLVDIALEKVGAIMPDGVGVMIDLAKGAFKTIKDKAIEWAKEQLNMGGPEGVSGGMGLVGAAGNWRSQIQRAAAQMGETVSPTEINGILAQINRESGGNQRIVQSSAVWDVNTAAGNPARGLLQYIPQTFNAYKVRGHENIYSGYDQLLAFFNNRTWRRDLPYGRRGWGPRGGRKYKQGTNYVPEDGPAYLHKGEAVIPAEYNKPSKVNDWIDAIEKRLSWIESGGWAESIISNDPAKRLSQRGIWERTGRELGFIDKSDDKTGKEVISLLMRIADAVETGRDLNLVFQDRATARILEPLITERQKRKNNPKKGGRR